MISSFKYLSPIQEAYSKVVESETSAQTTPQPIPSDSEAKELLDSKKGSPYRMSDEERLLFYKDEIKRLRRIQKYFEQQKRYVNGQGYVNGALRSNIEKYEKEVERMEREKAAQTNSVPQFVSAPVQPQN